MSEHSLPKTIDPLKYADQHKVLEGSLSIKVLPRLAEMLVNSDGVVAIKLSFGRDEQHLRIVQGELSAKVMLSCERCLNPVEKQVDSEFTLGIVLDDEQAKNLPRAYEPLLVDPEHLDVYEMVEEELILSLPMFAYHEDCDSGYQQTEEETEQSEAEKPNPFSVLSELNLKK